MASTMLNEYRLPKYFWAEAISTACYTLNRVLLRPIISKTPYGLYFGYTPKINYFRVFGSKCYILNSKDYLTKFDPKSDEGVFLGYSTNSKAYRIFNLRSLLVEESLNVSFDESLAPPKYIDLAEYDENIEKVIRSFEELKVDSDAINPLIIPDETPNLPKDVITRKDHSLENVIGDLYQGVKTRAQVHNVANYLAFLSQNEPKSVKDVILDEDWI